MERVELLDPLELKVIGMRRGDEFIHIVGGKDTI